MLTTIGDKIVEIRPKQIIESNIKIDNNYLVPLNKISDPHYKYVKKVKSNEKPTKQSPRYTKTKT
jgi:hypothetical protein